MNTKIPDDSLRAEIEAHSIDIARQAGKILCEHFRKPLAVQFKGKKNNDPVTNADRLSNEYLEQAINGKFPQHSILSEEGGVSHESGSPFIWVLDPLDGTVNFMNGLPLFAVSVGVLWNKQAVAGSIYVPVSHWAAEGVYHARLGQGAFLDSEKIVVGAKLSARPITEMPVHFKSRFILSGQSRKEPFETRNLGSIALELAMAAGGIFRYSLFGRPKLWDVAAGVLLIKEAGGLSLIRKPGGKDWLVLESFQPDQDNDSGSLENLRNWSLPLLVGAPGVVEKVAKDIRVRYNPLSSLAALFRSRGKP